MHSSQGLTPDSSMRTHNLALNPQSRQKLAMTHAEAGAMHLDEYSQLLAELNNAAALRTTYAREAKFKLDRNVYHKPQERYGRLAMLTYGGDHLQLPPVPASASVLASLDNKSDEHKVGARIFRKRLCASRIRRRSKYSTVCARQVVNVSRVHNGVR